MLVKLGSLLTGLKSFTVHVSFIEHLDRCTSDWTCPLLLFLLNLVCACVCICVCVCVCCNVVKNKDSSLLLSLPSFSFIALTVVCCPLLLHSSMCECVRMCELVLMCPCGYVRVCLYVSDSLYDSYSLVTL